ncbi:hypothetical protein JOQ06_024591, partial [Pogonophryne albipinna]
MVCMWSAWRRGSVFAARLAKRDWPCCFSAGLSVRYRDFSTKTAPHIPGMEYQDAICTLNTLQTNASALEQVEELDHLNIIHVTGTKGK